MSKVSFSGKDSNGKAVAPASTTNLDPEVDDSNSNNSEDEEVTELTSDYQYNVCIEDNG